MFSVTPKNQRGFTLIELLALMAIVGVLSGIVAIAVGGTGETSKDTQTKQDATTVETAASDFFADQEGAEVLNPLSANVLDQGPFQQLKSSRWPEEYVSVVYAEVLPPTTTSTVFSVTFITETGTISTITLEELLTKFNAVDFNALIAGNFMAVEPDGATQLTENRYNNYLWLLKKSSAAAGSSEGAARQVAVFKLVSILKNENDDLVDLTYLQLVGDFTAASDLIEDVLVDEDADNTVIPLGAFFTTAAITGNTNDTLVTATLTGLDLTLDFLADQNGTATIKLLGTLINGEPVEVSFLVTVDAVNDRPSFSIISDPAPVLDTAGIQTAPVTGITPGPVSATNEDGQTVSFAVSLLSETATDVITGLSFNSATDTISYTPANAGKAFIQVVADDGQTANNNFEQVFTVTVGPTSVVVPNDSELTEGDNFANTPFGRGPDAAIRWQQRYPASQFTGLNGLSTKITQIAFRPQGPGGGVFSNSTFTGIEIDLATISSQIPLSSTFDSNLPDSTTVRVYDGTLVLSSSNLVLDTPRKAFDIVINLQTPFLYDPADGDLVLEVRIPTGGAATTTAFDAVSFGPAGLGRLQALVDIAQGSLTVQELVSQVSAVTPILGGIVTQFTFELVP